ncbi:MAG: hypothetical protein OEY14_00640, partial [Myxococcales bacterium]|nr:hypothetical protein [Myxococcales bacterium]
FVARGARLGPDERGLLPSREVYSGPLRVRLESATGRRLRVDFDGPNSPQSTPLRTIYRRRLDFPIASGDRLIVEPIDGWIESRLAWNLPREGTVPPLGEALLLLLAAFLVFGGLLSLALALGRRSGGMDSTQEPLEARKPG